MTHITHLPIIETDDPDDPSPHFTIATRCTCGKLIHKRTFHLAGPETTAQVIAEAQADAREGHLQWLLHLYAAGGGDHP